MTIKHEFEGNSAICSNMILNAKDQIGSILVSVAPENNLTGFYNNYNNKKILIEENIITNTQVYGICAINGENVTIRNNVITNAFMNGAGNVGSFYGFTPKSGIFVGKSSNVYVTGNTVYASATTTQAVEIYSNCLGTIVNTGNTLQ